MAVGYKIIYTSTDGDSWTKVYPWSNILEKSNIIKNSKTIIFVADALQIKNLNSWQPENNWYYDFHDLELSVVINFIQRAKDEKDFTLFNNFLF